MFQSLHKSWLALAAAGVVVGGCNDSINSGSAPNISVEPSELNFGSVTVGQSTTRTLSVSNSGESTLVISSVDIQASTGFVTYTGGASFEVEPGDIVEIGFQYGPTDPTVTTGQVVLATNDPDRPAYEVEIIAAAPTPRPSVYPPILDFGLVGEGSENTLDTAIRNIGTAPLVLCSVRLIGSPDMTSNAAEAIQAGLDADLGYVVVEPVREGAAIDELPLQLYYTPSSPGGDNAELVVEYDTDGFLTNPCADGETSTESYPIGGEAGAPTLSVSPNPINFGETPINFPKRQTITLTNVGELDLEIRGIAIDPARNSGDFALEDLPSVPATLAPDESIFLTGVYEPSELGTDAAVMVVTHGDGVGGEDTTEVTMAGVGVEDSCPVAVARAYMLEDPENRVGTDEINWALPLQTLILDGRESFDPDGPVVDWEWSIVSAPEDAVAGLRDYALPGDEATPALQQYFVPLAGRYEFELRVFDSQGATCDPTRVIVIATPQEAITVEVVWDNPNDPDQGDTEGSDVDLHFVKMPNAWFHPIFDTYFSNTEPTWSPELPSLDIDDTDGAGPETVQLDNPDNDQCYAIGVHYFRERFGTTYPTIRIYFDGTLVEEIYGELRATDDFLDVARIHWPSRTIYRVEQVTEGFDSDDRVLPVVTDEMIRNDHCVGIGG